MKFPACLLTLSATFVYSLVSSTIIHSVGSQGEKDLKEKNNVLGVVTTERELGERRTRYLKSEKSSKKSKKKKNEKGKNKKSKKSKKNKMKIQKGFTPGMTNELQGLWVGDETFDGQKAGYYEYMYFFDYCSQAIFDGRGGYLTWMAGSSTCDDMGVDPVTGSVDNDNYLTAFPPAENYILKVDQFSCMEEEHCSYDIFANTGLADKLDGWTLVAKTCGIHLKKDAWRTNEEGERAYSCELYQVNLIMNESSGEYKKVAVLTYGSYYESYDNYVCPSMPTFDRDALSIDPHAEGAAIFFMQSSFEEDWQSTDNWNCTAIVE